MAKPITEATIARLPIIMQGGGTRELQNGNLLFMCGNYPQSRVIKALTKSPFSHVAVFVRLLPGGSAFVLESAKGVGVRMMAFEKYVETYNGKIVGGQFPPSKEFNLEAGLNWAFALVGYAEYDFDDNLSSGYKIITGAGEVKVDNDFQCAELVAGYWRAGGYDSGYDKRGFVSPDSLWRDRAVTLGARLK